MSEFELAYFHNEYGNSISLNFSVFMTGLFAMLLASRYIASSLGRFMEWFIIILFTLFTIFSGRGVNNSIQSYYAMGDILREGNWESPVLRNIAENAPTEFQSDIALLHSQKPRQHSLTPEQGSFEALSNLPICQST